MISQNELIEFLNNELSNKEFNKLYFSCIFAGHYITLNRLDYDKFERSITVANKIMRKWSQDQITNYINEKRLEKL